MHRSPRQALRTVLMENPQRTRRRKSVTHKFPHHKLPCLGGIRECTLIILHPSNSSKLPTSSTCSSNNNSNRALEASIPCHRRLECPTNNSRPGRQGRQGWKLVRGGPAGTDNDAQWDRKFGSRYPTYTLLIYYIQKKKKSPASSDVSFWQDRGVVETDFSSSYLVFSASEGSEIFILDAMARKGSTHEFSVTCKAQRRVYAWWRKCLFVGR